MTDSTMTEIPLVERLEAADKFIRDSEFPPPSATLFGEAAAMLKAAVDALESAKDIIYLTY